MASYELNFHIVSYYVHVHYVHLNRFTVLWHSCLRFCLLEKNITEIPSPSAVHGSSPNGGDTSRIAMSPISLNCCPTWKIPKAIKSVFFTESYWFHLNVDPVAVHFHYIMHVCGQSALKLAKANWMTSKLHTNERHARTHHVTFSNLYILPSPAIIYDEWLEKTLDSKICVGAAIMDLSIAFDRLPHNRLVTDYLSLLYIMQRNCYTAWLLM